MHTNRISPARKFLLASVAALGLFLLAGCEGLVVSNLTAPSLPENPSQIYTIQLRATPKTSTIDRGSIVPHIVIDGQTFPMTPAAIGENLWEYDYHLPPGRSEIAYYFLVNYSVTSSSGTQTGEVYTELNHATVVRRYVLALDINRGQVGANIGINGRGFTTQDTVYLGDTPSRTVYYAPNAIAFYVPAVATGHTYPVSIRSSSGSSPVGSFQVDPSTITVNPSSLTLHTGEHQSLSFTIPNAAPEGGLLLDVTTDVPESVIMPEVLVPAGQTTVTIDVQGGKPGTGSLFLKGYGTGEVTIPVTVQ